MGLGIPQGTQGQAEEAGTHLAVDIGQAGLGGLQEAARGIAGAAGSVSVGRGGLVSVPQDRFKETKQVQPQDPPPRYTIHRMPIKKVRESADHSEQKDPVPLQLEEAPTHPKQEMALRGGR